MTDEHQQDPAVPAKKCGFWQTFKNHIIHPEKTPGEVALSFAIGLSIAWNPMIGLHTVLVIVICMLSKRLHRPLILATIFVNNPWTLVPMATASAYVGNILLGRGLNLDLKSIAWHSLGWRSFVTRAGAAHLMKTLEPILAPYFLGGAILSLLALGLGYVGMRWIAVRMRRVHLPHLHLPHHHTDHS